MHVFVFISTRSERYSYINTMQEHHCVVRDGKRSFKNSRHFKQNHFELNVLIPVEYNILPSLYNFLLIFRIISSYRRQWIRLSGKINMSTIINITCQPLSTLHVNHYQLVNAQSALQRQPLSIAQCTMNNKHYVSTIINCSMHNPPQRNVNFVYIKLYITCTGYHEETKMSKK